MTRYLLLLRHAKAEGAAAASSDHDRPLAPRGVAAAKRVGEWLAGFAPELDLVVASTALRAAETARLALLAGGLETALRLERGFYESDVPTLLEHVRSLDDACRCVLLVGHEPTWSALASALAGGGSLRLPTGAVAGVRFEAPTWSAVEPGAGELRFLVTPKVLGE
jgi:phosphohistidine phosphatase